MSIHSSTSGLSNIKMEKVFFFSNQAVRKLPTGYKEFNLEDNHMKPVSSQINFLHYKDILLSP